jgi:hypothetical protein
VAEPAATIVAAGTIPPRSTTPDSTGQAIAEVCLRRWASHGQATAQASAGATSPPAGDSIARRTTVQIEVFMLPP